MKRIFFLFLLLPFLVFSQHQLSVNVTGVKSSDGNINVAVYDTSEGFLKFDKVYTSNSATAEKGITQLIIADLADGEYALAVFHDKNGNNELDTNFIGIPKEPIGFSKAKMKMFGPPCFEECAFQVKSNIKIQVVL